jgi:DNA-binding transcriptional LysR family regulator
MMAKSLDDLVAFLAVARERNFTRAAARLGVSQSAQSQTIRGLEAWLGLRLLTRTTRSVAPTEAGQRLLETVGPRLDEIDAELAALSARCARNRPARSASTPTSTRPNRSSGRRWKRSCRLPGHQGRDRYRQRPDRHRRRAVRRRRPPRRTGREGHDRRAHWTRLAHGGGRRAFLFRQMAAAADAARPRRPQLHQSALADLRRPLRLGVRERQTGAQGSRRRATRVQRHCSQAERGAGRARPCVPARGPGARASRRWEAHPGAGGLVQRPSPATISTIPAAASPRPPSPCLSTCCAIAGEDARPSHEGVNEVEQQPDRRRVGPGARRALVRRRIGVYMEGVVRVRFVMTLVIAEALEFEITPHGNSDGTCRRQLQTAAVSEPSSWLRIGHAARNVRSCR